MSKKSSSRGHFDKQDGKWYQTLFKSARQHLYHIDWSLSRQLIWRKSLLLTCQILGLLVNAFADDGKYPVFKRINLEIPIQKQLSQKQKNFAHFFAAFFKSGLNFEHFENSWSSIHFVFRELQTLKTRLNKCLKSPVLEHHSASNMANEIKQSPKCTSHDLYHIYL